MCNKSELLALFATFSHSEAAHLTQNSVKNIKSNLFKVSLRILIIKILRTDEIYKFIILSSKTFLLKNLFEVNMSFFISFKKKNYYRILIFVKVLFIIEV